MPTIIAHSTHMEKLHKRIAELATRPGFTLAQVTLQVRSEFSATLAPNAIKKAIYLYRCGLGAGKPLTTATANYKNVKAWSKNLAKQNTAMRGKVGGTGNAKRKGKHGRSEEETVGEEGSGTPGDAHEGASERHAGEAVAANEVTKAWAEEFLSPVAVRSE